MSGRKFRKDKNEIRYHRVDLAEEDSFDDDEARLNRDLGPPKKRRNCGKITRGIFIVCTVLLTLAGLVSIVAYTAIMFPEGPSRQLNYIYEKVFGEDERNSTAASNTTTINPNSTRTENVTLTTQISGDRITTTLPKLANETDDMAIDHHVHVTTPTKESTGM